MNKVLRLCVVFIAAGLGLWLFPALSIAVGAPNEITVLKSDGIAQATAGDGVTYSYVITVTNTGSDAVNGVDLSDTWPSRFTRVGVTTNRGSCDTTTSLTNFTCSFGRMPGGSNGVVTASYSVPADTPAGDYTNTVLVDFNNGAPVPASDVTTVVTTAALGLEKNDGVSQVAAGNGVTYRYVMTVTNSGPSVASNVAVTDTWPAGFARGLVQTSQGGCSTQTSPTDFTCGLGDLLVGANAIITASYTVPAATLEDTYTNTVRAGSDNGTTVSAHDSTSVVAAADVRLIKSDGVSQVAAGNGVTYRYVTIVTNYGPSVANNVVVTDTWPAAFERGLVTVSQGGCVAEINSSNFICTLGGMAVGANATITASYSVPSGTPGGTYTNLVEADSDMSIPFLASDDTTVVINADLGLVKTDGVSQVTAGDGITYTYVMTVTNNGPSLAGQVVVTDTWPTGFERLRVGASQGGCDTQTDPSNFTCSLGGMAVGASATITASYRVPGGTPAGTYTNLLEADSEVSSIPAAVSDTTDVLIYTDLGLEKNDGISQVIAGDGITYNYVVTVTNSGLSLARNVVVTDTWPASFALGQVSMSQGICSTQTNPTDFICELGDLAVGANALITATYSVPYTATAGIYTNTVYAGADNSTIITASDANTVITTADLWLLKSDGVSQVTAGSGITYRYVVTVNNDGPSLARNVVVTDTWPLSFVRGPVDTSHGTCDTLTDPDDFTCGLGNLAVGASATITASYTVPNTATAGVYTNTVQARSDESATVSTNDENTVLVTAGLVLEKSDGVSQVIAGSGITYRYVVTVANDGPSLARNVVVTDTWPAGFERLLVDPSQGNCVPLAGSDDFTCGLGNLAVGASAMITASYSVPVVTPAGTYINTVEAGSADGAIDSASDVNTVILHADLSLSIQDQPDPVVSGRWITYTMQVSNAGPVNAVGVQVTDGLPVGLTFTAAGSSPECALVAGTVSCNLGNLASGASRQVLIKAQVSTSVAGIVNNQVLVGSNLIDPDETDNLAEASTIVLDQIIPSVTWVSPVGNEGEMNVVCQYVRLEANATDNHEVYRVRFRRWVVDLSLPGGGFFMDIASDYAAPYTSIFYTCNLQMGWNQIYANAYDTAGNVSERKRILLYKSSNDIVFSNIFMPMMIK